jgi:4'-phosphopantetheinyl transferase
MIHAPRQIPPKESGATLTLPRGVRVGYAPLEELWAEPLESPGGWLTTGELVELARLHDSGRRNQWLAGRRLAKRLIAELSGERPADIQILTRNQRGLGVRPRITIQGRLLAWALSISHSDCAVLAAVAPRGALRLGVDLASAMPASERFVRTWFSAAERRWLEGQRSAGAQTLWAIKEAVYKAANDGEGWNPRQIEVLPLSTGQLRCVYRGRQLERLVIEICHFDDHVAAIACLATHVVACDNRSKTDEINHSFRNAS